MEVVDNSTNQVMGRPGRYLPGVFVPEDVAGQGVVSFLDEELCRVWILGQVHERGVDCPGCGGEIVSKASLQSFWAGARVKCGRCGKYFTALTNTFLSGVHLSYSAMVMMAILIAAGADDATIAGLMHLSAEGVRGWRCRFKLAGMARTMLPAVDTGKGIEESRDAATGGAGAER